MLDARAHDFRTQLVRIDLEMIGADRQCGPFVDQCRIVCTPQPYQVRRVATEGLTIGFEGERAKEAPDLFYMVGVFRRDQQVDVDGRTFSGADPIAHLDVGKDEVHIRQPPRLLVRAHGNIRIDTVVISDADRPNVGSGCFELRKKLFPGILATVLIVQDRPGGV